MEIVVSPSQPAPSGWSRILVVLGVFMPVTVLALLPICLGLERYVVTNDDMAPAIGRGAVVLERKVPASDLRAGDVITFRPPSEAGVEGRVTRRIVSIDGDRAHTRADARPAPDPWTLPLDRPTEQRVVTALPYVGYVYLALVDSSRAFAQGALAIGALALVLALLVGRRRVARA
ncbi:S26 family signal peptidase [Nocardioides ungokensis]|uniref:S26 family signal peptidase n=1 Tax=Nocardioides ungokensis TaxID=1643322 RepID=UPI0015DD8BA5|nr:S26 family signal peptidase [Nocardioides ungokensis]